MLPLVDTHQHMWDLEQFSLSWLKDPSLKQLKKNFSMSDYLKASSESEISATVYMEVDVDPTQREEEADFIIEICRQEDNPMAGAVLGGNPDDDGFAAYATRFKENPYVKGFRQVLQTPKTPRGHCLGPKFVRGVRALGEIDKSFDLCMRPSELSDGVQLVDRCPDTLIIVDHCGNADPMVVNGSVSPDPNDPYFHNASQWRRDIAALAKRKNTVCKISGVVARAPSGWHPEILAPTVEHCLDSFGPDRVVFGGDWPVCTFGAPLADWISGLRQIVSSKPQEEQRRLFHKNAQRLYKLT
ncbi:MAG: hypothetical protein DF168_00106 [Candidatus Moanabacter tarae]|uniref:Amidohydrolase-related domain-containing protein n=1 Tax=Candidatus Moanibacter tarae TaxID=2200854 RepID=A0A2Z4AFV7_9BACT|nr:MAG: hypothetical protein DF168_00106 [Candidatus Moanabacter tarae]